MNGSLQDLVNLDIFTDDQNNLKCFVRFKGRVESHSKVDVGDLLGDLLSANCKFDLLLFPEVEYIDEKYKRCFLFDENENMKANNLDVSNILLDCYERNSVQYIALKEYLDLLSSSDNFLSREKLDFFLLSTGLYVPSVTLISVKKKYIETFNEFEIWAPDEWKDCYNRLVGYNQFSNCYLLHSYECDTFFEIIVALLHYTSTKGKYIRKCRNCGKYFIPLHKSDEKYCRRQTNGKSCKEIATAKKRRVRDANNPLTKKYNNVSTALSNRINAANISDEEIERRRKMLWDFRDDYSSLKQTLTIEELIEWLDSYLEKNK